MRRVTRNVVLAILAVLVLLLALGGLPGLLGSGEPYYVTATPTDSGEASSIENDDVAAVPSANLSRQTYPFTTAALADASGNDSGRSEPYRSGPFGFKEAFTHSPFDELDALRQQYPDATVDEDVRVSRNGTLYRVAVTQ